MGDALKISTQLIEPMILAYSLINVSFFLKIKQYLDTSLTRGKCYFNDEKYQRVFNILCKYFDKYKKFPKEKTFKSIIDKVEKNSEIKLLLNSIISTSYSYDPNELDPIYIEDETLSFIKDAKVYEAIIESQKDIEDKNFSSIMKRMENAVRINFDKDLGLSIRDTDEGLRRIKQLDDTAKISTGYQHFDTLLDGGFHPKELYAIAGVSSTGKTLILGCLAINAFLNNKKAVVYTFETSTERLLIRYLCNLLNMDKKSIMLDDSEKIKDMARKRFEITEGDLIIKEYNAHGASANDLLIHLNDLEMYKQFKPDIIFIDYLLIMAADDKRLSPDDSYRYYKAVAEESRNIGKSLYIPVVAPVQLNRDAMSDRGGSKAVVSGKNVAESAAIYHTADFFAGIVQTSGDKKNERLFLTINKNRNEGTGQKLEFSINYEQMKLIEKGVY